MAALVAGVQYGLSSHSNFPENKSLIFVKLTDSAQRAIEDFLRNGNTTNQNPTIQFLGNEGQLSFPSTQSSHGSAGFTFSLSGNQDIEGPQGGFECIQQTGPKSLESLGTLPWKMRIQANDDVYETTRHRMVEAEENNKNKCTRVIKANGPDIGRKVKVKATGRTIPPPIGGNTSRHGEFVPTSQPSRPAAAAAAAAVVQTPVSSSTTLTSKPIKNPPLVRQHEKKFSDIMRRPLRERLIHLLALRPYKRPELYDRINKEGIKERDRSTTTTLLKQVACMKDNTYHLHRHVWNDVQEDWPYYTEQEKAMLKRRKPQNLTPPGSSDGGSSGSGQSPNSTHPGSPPAITAPPPPPGPNKRPGYYQSADGLQTKRPRISHFRKSDARSNVAGGGGSVVSGGGGGGGGGGGYKQQNNRDRADYRTEGNGAETVLLRNYGNACLTPTSDAEEGGPPPPPPPTTNGGGGSSNVSSGGNSRDNRTTSSGKSVVGENNIYTGRIDFARSSSGGRDRGSSRSATTERGDRERSSGESSTAGTCNDLTNLGGGTSRYAATATNYRPTSPTISSTSKDYPDYLAYYTTISSTEQRRRYKDEFNADYEEYRKLHSLVAKVSKRFAHLEERRRREIATGNRDKIEEIELQILQEYNEIKSDPIHRETKKRFDYLHEKLSHLKRLVHDYDAKNSLDNGGGPTTRNGNGVVDIEKSGSLRY